MTYRLLGVLLAGLPGESLYKTTIRDEIDDAELAELAKQPRDGHGSWSHEALLLAACVDRIELLRRDLVAVNGGKPGQFEPLPRPGVARAKRRALTEQGFAYLQRLRDEHERLHGAGGETASGTDQGPDVG